MDVRSVIIAFQIVFAVVLTGLVIIQSKGTGLGRAFGGSGTTSFTRRGLEKLLFKITFIISALFLFSSVLAVVI